MAATYQTYVSDGTTRQYAVPFPYLDQDHVKVSVDGVLQAPPVFLSSGLIQLPVAPAGGSVVEVRRKTPTGVIPVDFTDGSVLDETDLDTLAKYSAYLSEEALDVADGGLLLGNDGAYNAQERQINGLAPGISPTSAATKGQLDALAPLFAANVALSDNLRIQAETARNGAETARAGAEAARAGAEAAEANANSLRPDLAATSGSSLVGFIQSGTGAVARTIESELRDAAVSVKQFGALGNGADSTGAFSAAAKGAPAAVNITGAEGALPRAPMCRVRVPAGAYLLTSEVDTGGREVVWEVDQAATITGHSFINGEIVRVGQRQADYHHGTTDYACSYSIRSNTDLEDGAEVLGITTASQLATYGDRDSVSLYVDNASPPATVDVDSATYTSSTVTVAAPGAAKVRQYRRGMVIDTKHTPKWSGIVDSWSEDGSTITVTEWYRLGGGGTPGTPSNGTGCVVNGFTKVWAHNANVFLTASGYASSACGFELGSFNFKGDSASDFRTTVNRLWGFDSVKLDGASSNFRGQAAYMARGDWWTGYFANGQVTGFKYRGNASGVMPFVAVDANDVSYYNVNNLGEILAGAASRTAASAGTAVIEGQSTSKPALFSAVYSGNDATPPIFHFVKNRASGDVQNGDSLGEVRFEGAHTAGYRRGASILASVSGTPSATSMPGVMYLRVSKAGSTSPSAAVTIQPDHHIAAGADNAQSMGTAAARWSTVFAGTGTINTSDARAKQQIAELNATEVAVAKRLKGLIRTFRFNDAVTAKGDNARIHVGVIAQEVQAAFAAEGLDAMRYAILCYDEWGASPPVLDEFGEVVTPGREAGNRYGVRYDQLLAFIIGAME